MQKVKVNLMFLNVSPLKVKYLESLCETIGTTASFLTLVITVTTIKSR